MRAAGVPLVVVLLLLVNLVFAQEDDSLLSTMVESNCSAALLEQIDSCLEVVQGDEGLFPCDYDEWPCFCNRQQGIIDCYAPCPYVQSSRDIGWNQDNCQGQHGFANLAGGNVSFTYVGSPVTTEPVVTPTRAYYSRYVFAGSKGSLVETKTDKERRTPQSSMPMATEINTALTGSYRWTSQQTAAASASGTSGASKLLPVCPWTLSTLAISLTVAAVVTVL